MTDAPFKGNFRPRRSIVTVLLRQIGPYLHKHDTKFRARVPVEKRLCCTLYTLGSSSELRTIARSFDIEKAQPLKYSMNFVHRFIKFSSINQEIKNKMNGFMQKFSYPLCIEASDSTHVDIKSPIILLSTVNSDLEFICINAASVYSRSNL